MIEFGEIGTMIASNVLAALLGFLLGQLVQWRRAKVHGHSFIVPTVVGGTSRAYRITGSILALLAVITVAQSAYTSYQMEQSTQERRAAYQEQLACNKYLFEQLTARAEEWTHDHRNTTRFVDELNVALKIQESDVRYDRLADATERYLDQERRLADERAKAPLRTPACP